MLLFWGFPEGKIDLLINNAGVGFIKNTEQASEEEVRNIFDIQTPEEVSEVIVTQLKHDHLPLRIRTSPWAEDFCQYKTQTDPTGLLQTKAITASMLGKH